MFSQWIGKKVNKFVPCLLGEIDPKGHVISGPRGNLLLFYFCCDQGQRSSEDALGISDELMSVNFSS